MAIIVEHDKRKREILNKALDIFIEEGYEDATFQKIADRCGITRTTLYLYFKNKREIFVWSIKQLTEGLERGLLEIIGDKSLPAEQRLRSTLDHILDACVENRRLFSVILTYLLQIQKTGKDPASRVRRRILRLRHLLSTLFIDGIKSGEFRRMNVKSVNELFYALIESCIFRLAVLNQQDVDELRTAISLGIEGILTEKTGR